MIKKSVSGLLLLIYLLAACGKEERIIVQISDIAPEDSVFIFINGGTFVTSSGDTTELQDFRIAKFEVTNRLYINIAPGIGVSCPPDPVFPGMNNYIFDYPDYPVTNMSPDEAERIASALGCRLPSVAEWEYAVSLGIPGWDGADFDLYPWGSLDPVDMDNPSNYLYDDKWESRGLDGYLWTSPVGAFPLNDLMIADLAGNVSEIVTCDSGYILCGGAWSSVSKDLQIGGSHTEIQPSDRARHIGFRLVK